MIIVCDSGSTKADWQVVNDNGEQYLVTTMGFNPFFHNEDRIENELRKDFVKQVPETKVDKIFYYGAGCSDELRDSIVEIALRRIFKNASVIKVEHDLLAAARATCGTAPGIACIIGTGSNTCLYDGNKIVDNVTNLGHMLGDEGSGSWLGKMLIKGYFYREMPDDLQEAFVARYVKDGDDRDIINQIYGEAPNVYCAGFARFFSEHSSHLYIQKLVMQAFDELIRRHIQKYKNHTELPIHFIGSIAYHFKDILKIALDEHNLTLGNVIQKPIDSLVEYHLAEEKKIV